MIHAMRGYQHPRTGRFFLFYATEHIIDIYVLTLDHLVFKAELNNHIDSYRNICLAKTGRFPLLKTKLLYTRIVI